MHLCGVSVPRGNLKDFSPCQAIIGFFDHSSSVRDLILCCTMHECVNSSAQWKETVTLQQSLRCAACRRQLFIQELTVAASLLPLYSMKYFKLIDAEDDCYFVLKANCWWTIAVSSLTTDVTCDSCDFFIIKVSLCFVSHMHLMWSWSSMRCLAEEDSSCCIPHLLSVYRCYVSSNLTQHFFSHFIILKIFNRSLLCLFIEIKDCGTLLTSMY